MQQSPIPVPPPGEIGGAEDRPFHFVIPAQWQPSAASPATGNPATANPPTAGASASSAAPLRGIAPVWLSAVAAPAV
jgi:hypothetical protein